MSKNCSQKATTRPQNETKRVEQNAHDTLYKEEKGREEKRSEEKRENWNACRWHNYMVMLMLDSDQVVSYSASQLCRWYGRYNQTVVHWNGGTAA